jgi:uncharacterized protein YggE
MSIGRLLPAVLVVLLTPPAEAQQPAASGGPASIQVSAEATVSGKPDLAVLDLGVVSEGKTADAAAADNARRSERMVSALKKEVGPGGEVKTAVYTVGQTFGEPKAGQRAPIVGYTVSNTVRVKMPDVNAVGRLIDLGLKLGANEVRSVSFTFRDPEPLRAEALRAATSKARARAGVIASSLGLRLGPVISASDVEEGGGRPVPMALRRFKVAEAATPIEAGTLEVGATVTVVFSAQR